MDLVIFKSTDALWQKEFDGRKPNTVRVLSKGEFDERLGPAVRRLDAGKPVWIDGINADTGENFFRKLTDIQQVGEFLGYTMWVLSWQHEDGIGSYLDNEDEEVVIHDEEPWRHDMEVKQ